MTKTARDALVGVLYLAVIAALISLSIMVYNHDFTTYVDVDLHTGSVGSSLQQGSDVKVRGVLVGEVHGITTDGAGAVIHLRLDPAQVATLPPNMQAQLLPKTLFGERYVSLVFPSRALPGHLRSGDQISEDRSAQSIELERLFSDLLPVLQAVQPQKLSATLGEIAAALRGRGNDLATTMQTVGHYLDALAPHVPQITDDLAAFARVARTYNDAAPDLIAGLNSLTVTSRTLVAQRQDYTNLLQSVTSMADAFDSFVGTNQNQIIGLSSDSLPTLQIVAHYATEFPCLTRALVNYIPTANKAFGVGSNEPGAHVILHVTPTIKPYTIADRPVFADTSAPRCPYVPQTSLASTALAAVPGIAGANTTSATAHAVPNAGIGTANSPQENELIAELVAPTVGLSPSTYPKWASLLIGPALRGTQVSLR